MSISKYNPEGYLDLTAYAALTAIEKEQLKAKRKEQRKEHKKKMNFRPLAFICSPYAGNIEHNVARARGYCRFAISKNRIPQAPHLLFPQFMDDGDSDQRNLAIQMGLVLMHKCAEVWVFGERITEGMRIEIDTAKRRRIPIWYFNEKCEVLGEDV